MKCLACAIREREQPLLLLELQVGYAKLLRSTGCVAACDKLGWRDLSANCASERTYRAERRVVGSVPYGSKLRYDGLQLRIAPAGFLLTLSLSYMFCCCVYKYNMGRRSRSVSGTLILCLCIGTLGDFVGNVIREYSNFQHILIASGSSSKKER